MPRSPVQPRPYPFLFVRQAVVGPMPKRNLLLILAAIVAATAVVMMTRPNSTLTPIPNSELANYRGVAEAARKIRSEWYPIPTPDDSHRNGHATTVPSDEELRREMVRGMFRI